MTFDLKGRPGWGPAPRVAAARLLTGGRRTRTRPAGARRRPISVPLTVGPDLLPRTRVSAAPLHQGPRVPALLAAASALHALRPVTSPPMAD